MDFSFLQNEYNELVQKIAPSKTKYLFLTKRRDDGSSHVEFENGEYHLVTTERGLELSRRTTKEKEELLYWLISQDTFWIAVNFELKNRIEEQDCRRIIFAKQIELLEKINLIWAKKKQKKIEKILAKNPYIDKTF